MSTELQIIELKDVALRFSCGKCEAALSIKPANVRRHPQVCPSCTTPWPAISSQGLDALINYLGAAQPPGDKDPKGYIRFEIDVTKQVKR